MPQQPPRPRQSIAAAQGTPPDHEALPSGTLPITEDTDSCSVPSSQETPLSQGSIDANLEADSPEPNNADDSRKVTLRRSGRMSKSRSESSVSRTDAVSSRKRHGSRMESNSHETTSPENNKHAGTKATLDLPRRTRSGRLLQSPTELQSQTDEDCVSPRPRRRSCSTQSSQRDPSETVASESQRHVAGGELDVRSSSSQGSEISACDTEDGSGHSRGADGHGADNTRHRGDATENSRGSRGRSRGDAGYSVRDATHHGGDAMHSPADITRSEGDTRHNTVDTDDNVGDNDDNVGDAEGSEGNSQGDTRHSASDNTHSAGDTRHSAGDTRHSAGDTRHSAGDTRHSASDTRHSAGDTRHSESDNEDNSSETVHHLMDAEHTERDIMCVASVHNVSVCDKPKGGTSSEVGMDTLDFLSDSSGQSKKASVEQVNASVRVEQMGDDTTESDTDRDEQSIDDGGVVVDDNVECSTDDVKTSQSSADVDDDGSHSTGATRDGAADKEPGVIRTDVGSDRRSLHRTPSALSINADCSDDELRDESAGVVSQPQAASADRLTETRVAAPDHVTCASDGETSEDFEVAEPCFRVFGVQKQNSLSNRSPKAKSDLEGDSCAQKDETKVKSIVKKRARKTTGKKTTKNVKLATQKKVKSATQKKVKSATQSPGVIGHELEASRQEIVGQKVKGKRTQNAQAPVASTETPIVPSQQLGSMRRKINLSPPVQSPNASLSSSPVVARSLSPGRLVSSGDLRETPQDEASRHEATSSGDESLSHPHPKVTLACPSQTSTEQGSIPDGENEGDASGKRKSATPRTRKGCSSEKKKKRRGSKSPKRGRRVSSQVLSEDEDESAPGESIGKS